MLKFPFVEWEWLIQYKRDYSEGARGDLTPYFKWVPHFEKGRYDFAILHLDQQCFEEGIYERGKGRLYKDLVEVIGDDCPVIVICHGTPYYPEKFTNEELVKIFKEKVKTPYVIMNSHRAVEQWGFGKCIWHGMNPDEWWDLPKELRVVTMISPGGFPKYYDRQFLDAIRDELDERGIDHCHITVDWKAKNWDEYRNFLGRSLIYLNPTRESPMPRSRTEAMLSGCCVLTTPWQDADKFIEDGKNGFIIPRNPKWVADKIEYLFEHYDEAIKVGQEGKKTAQEIFNQKRYEREWKEYLDWVKLDWSKNATKRISK